MMIRVCSNKGLYMQREEAMSEGAAAVLCTSVGLNPSRYDWLEHKLLLNFDDITNERRPTAFRPEYASQIAAFVKKLPKNQTLYFCCDSGESRSTALAAAFLRAFDKDEMQIWKNPHYHPNLLVYRLQCEALGIMVNEQELLTREAISARALAEAIQNSRRND